MLLMFVIFNDSMPVILPIFVRFVDIEVLRSAPEVLSDPMSVMLLLNVRFVDVEVLSVALKSVA